MAVGDGTVVLLSPVGGVQAYVKPVVPVVLINTDVPHIDVSGVNIIAVGVSIMFNVILSSIPQLNGECKYIVNVFVPPTVVGIPDTLNVILVSPAGIMVLSGAVKSVP